MKITPDIGTSASVALTFIPAIGAVLVGIASYLKRARNMDSIPRTPFEWISQGPIWDIILDLAKYLGYLQFIFLTGSLTMEYPGFYQPIVSQLSWASLLYWPGPINHGFTWTGIEDGIYVSNSSYGLEYMAQMMGYPAMPDIMLNSSINFVLLIAALCLLCLLVLAASPSTEKDLASLQSAGLAILGAVLSCFTLPVFSYMSYEFILIGYLPNYRVTLVGLAMTFLVYLNYAVTSHFEARRALDLTDASSYHARKSQSSLLGKIARTLSQWLPHAIALVEGIVIGGLQNWALAQVLVIAGCEAIVLVSTIIRRHTRLLWSRSFWCVIVRLLTVILCVTFVQPSSEAARQWIGYLILCLHAVVVVFGYLVASLWECSRALFRIIKSKRRDTSSGNMVSLVLTFSSPSVRSLTHDSTQQELPLQDMPPRFHLPTNEKAPHVWQRPSLESLPQAMRPGSSSTSHHPDFSDSDNRITPFLPTPTGIRHYVTDFSGFYRPPKSLSSRPPPSESVRTSSGAESAPASASASTAGSGSGSSSTSRNAPNHDSLDELLEPWVRPDVDYSTREVDLYYGRNRFSSETESSRAPVLTNTGAEAQENLFTRLTRGAGRLKPKKKEKGFQVARPPRPL